MLTVYKLTTQDNKTRAGFGNECVWGPGVTHSGTGRGNLCGPGYIHAYLSPALALFLNPIHANIPQPKLWECSISAISQSDKDLKIGAVSLTTVKEISIPTITNRHRAIFAILCAEKAQKIIAHLVTGEEPWQVVYREKMAIFSEWRVAFLENKTADAADAARAVARAAYAARAVARAAYVARAAARAATDAAYVARAAANAAYNAADAAYVATDAACVADNAARGAYLATDAARAAYNAAYVADAEPSTLDLVAIADLALTYSG